jgi:hypothetical protein
LAFSLKLSSGFFRKLVPDWQLPTTTEQPSAESVLRSTRVTVEQLVKWPRPWGRVLKVRRLQSVAGSRNDHIRRVLSISKFDQLFHQI